MFIHSELKGYPKNKLAIFVHLCVLPMYKENVKTKENIKTQCSLMSTCEQDVLVLNCWGVGRRVKVLYT